MDPLGWPTLGSIDVASPPVVDDPTAIEILFDRFLLPGSVTRQAVCLRSSPEPVVGYEGCTWSETLRPSYDPVRRAARFELDRASTRLAPDTLYTLTILAPRGEEDLGFRAFDGAALAEEKTLRFRTGPSSEPRPEARPEGSGWCADDACVRRCAGDPWCVARCGVGARRILTSTCASARCHGAGDEPGPAMGLALSDETSLAASAVGQRAHQSQVGPAGSAPQLSPVRFGADMRLIAPGDPGSSYLVYKMLLAPSLHANDPTLAPGELDRLRSFVVGLPMPVDATDADLAAVTEVSRWIARGAQLETCP